MDTDIKMPTPEQVEAQKQAEIDKWSDEPGTKIEVKYSNEEEVKDNAVSENADQDSTDNDGLSSDEDLEEYTESPSFVTAEDPGDYEPKDYSFEIEIDGKNYKVTSADQADELADEHAEKLNARQLGTLIRKGSKIDINEERDKDAWQKQKDLFDEQTTAQNEREENVLNIASEMEYLESKGFLLEVPKELKTADWDDTEVAKDPAIKQQKSLLNYFLKENKARVKANVKPFASMIDAFNGWQMERGKNQAIDAHKSAGEARKQAGARVAAPTTTQQRYVPAGIAVGNPNVFKRGGAVWE